MSNDNLTTKFNYAIHPGEILQDALDEHGLTQRDLADRIDVTPKHINEIIKGKASITSTFAQKLEFIFDTTPGYWLGLQKNYEEILARLAIREQFESEKDLVDSFTCYGDLVQYGYVKETRDKMQKYVELLSFFGISSLRLLERNYAVQFRKGKTQPNTQCMAAWLRMGELHFRGISTYKPFNDKKFRSLLQDVRGFTMEPIEIASKKLEEACYESGVVIAFTPYLKHTYVNGATRWLNSSTPLIQMSARMKSRDIFWFSFFHEAGHILKHSKKKEFIELQGRRDEVSNEEMEADVFAANTLIPPAFYQEFVRKADFTDNAIKSFSGSIGVGADIVAGRLASDGHKDWSQIMHLRHGIVVKPD